jgi:hypothetical protein
MKTLTKIEDFALGEYLNEYPTNMTFEGLLDYIDGEDRNNMSFPDDVEPCEYFEDWYPPALTERIQNLKEALERNFREKE